MPGERAPAAPPRPAYPSTRTTPRCRSGRRVRSASVPPADPELSSLFHLMLGYWQNETASARTLRNGVLHTGDVGFVDSRRLPARAGPPPVVDPAGWCQRVPGRGRTHHQRVPRHRRQLRRRRARRPPRGSPVAAVVELDGPKSESVLDAEALRGYCVATWRVTRFPRRSSSVRCRVDNDGQGHPGGGAAHGGSLHLDR